MQGKLIAELRARLIPKEWVKDNQYRAGYRKCLEETLGLISRHEAEQGEGLRDGASYIGLSELNYILSLASSEHEKKYAAGIERMAYEKAIRLRAPDKAVEPLAVTEKAFKLMVVDFINDGPREYCKNVCRKDYCTPSRENWCANKMLEHYKTKARAYLMALEDKEGA